MPTTSWTQIAFYLKVSATRLGKVRWSENKSKGYCIFYVNFPRLAIAVAQQRNTPERSQTSRVSLSRMIGKLWLILGAHIAIEIFPAIAYSNAVQSIFSWARRVKTKANERKQKPLFDWTKRRGAWGDKLGNEMKLENLGPLWWRLDVSSPGKERTGLLFPFFCYFCLLWKFFAKAYESKWSYKANLVSYFWD